MCALAELLPGLWAQSWASDRLTPRSSHPQASSTVSSISREEPKAGAVGKQPKVTELLGSGVGAQTCPVGRRACVCHHCEAQTQPPARGPFDPHPDSEGRGLAPTPIASDQGMGARSVNMAAGAPLGERGGPVTRREALGS